MNFIRTHWVKVALVLAFVWTVYNWSGLKEIKDNLHRAPILVVLAAFFEIWFNVGIALLLISAGRRLFEGATANPITWLKCIASGRKQLKTLLRQDSTSSMYKWGLFLNWVGAATVTGIIPIIAVMTLFPRRDWGLMAPAVVDLVATFVFRIPLTPRVRRVREEVQ